MAVSLRNSVGLCVCHKDGLESKERGVGSLEVLAWKNEFKGKQVNIKEQCGSGSDGWSSRASSNLSINAQSLVCLPRAFRWWEKGMAPNMIEVKSADDLVHSLLNAGDKLVVVGFYSPGCGGCKLLHPKICQIAERNSNVIFLKVNYDEHKAMCNSLHIHVLPFFRFYRGAQGCVCSFSCTNATIKKFRDALAKHGTDRCSLGPPKGLEESELLSLALNKEVNLTYPLASSMSGDLALPSMMSSIASSLTGNASPFAI